MTNDIENVHNEKECVCMNKNDAIINIMAGDAKMWMWPSELRDDAVLMLLAMDSYYDNIKYASKRLYADRAFVNFVLNSYGDALKYASDELRDDKDIVLLAIKHSRGSALSYASEKLKDDKDVVMTAVNMNGCCLIYASERLKNDKEDQL